MVRRAWRREELYHGPWVSYAPDVVLDLELDGDYSYCCLPSASATASGFVAELDASLLHGGKLTGMAGCWGSTCSPINMSEELPREITKEEKVTGTPLPVSAPAAEGDGASLEV